MKIQLVNQTTFNAKFIHSQSLKEVADHYYKIGEFQKLNIARKNINKAYLDYRLLFELGTNPDGYPYVSFTRFRPKEHIIIPKTISDYNISKPYIYTASEKIDPLEYGYKMIRKLGNSAPKNKMYQRIVAGK